MNENYIVINGKKAELTKEQMDQLGIKVEGSKRWRAALNDYYWFVRISDGNSAKIALEGVNPQIDNFNYYSHNYFRTEEEAETYARVLETEMLLKKYADEHNGEFSYFKCCITVRQYEEPSVICVLIDRCSGHNVWFSTEEITQNAINEIGQKRIKEYLTYEWQVKT